MSLDAIDDPITLLLPDAEAADLELARALSGAMRILSSDASDSGSMSVRVQLGSARTELDVYHEGSIGSLLQDLAIHAVSGAVCRSSFLRLPKPRNTYAEAWRRVFAVMTEAERQDLGVEVPRPGEPTMSVAGRIVEALERHACGATRDAELLLLSARHWRLRLGCFHGPAPEVDISASLEAILGELARTRGTRIRGLRGAVLGDLAALALDRGRVRDALEFVRRGGTSAIRSEDATAPIHVLGALLRWLDGEEGPLPALEAAYARCSAEAPLPEVWEEILELCGGASTALGGQSAASDPGVASVGNDDSSVDPSATVPAENVGPPLRGDLGASAVVVSVLRSDGAFQVVHYDVAPGLAGSLEGWIDRHRMAVAERGAPEHEALRGARSHVLFRDAGRRQDAADLGRYCIAGRSLGGVGEVRALAPEVMLVEPLLDGTGEPIGLIWIELPSRWLPARSLRTRWARWLAASELVGDVRGFGRSISGRMDESHTAAVPGPFMGPAPFNESVFGSAEDDLGEAWGEAVSSLQLKTAERRWIGFHVEGLDGSFERDVTLSAVAQGGGACDRLAEPDVAGAWAVRRSVRLGGPIRYSLASGEERADPVMLHRGAATGAALPVLRGGQVLGVLSLESARRGDAREVDVLRWFEALQLASPRLEAAALSGLDRNCSDGGWAYDAEEPGLPDWLGRLRSLGRANCDVLVTGETGTGRRTLARLIHHVGTLDGVDGDLVTRTAFGLDASEVD
ncbi:MAG: hypothetical protein AAGG01_08725, partial [Planctomycetota bacterium]